MHSTLVPRMMISLQRDMLPAGIPARVDIVVLQYDGTTLWPVILRVLFPFCIIISTEICGFSNCAGNTADWNPVQNEFCF